MQDGRKSRGGFGQLTEGKDRSTYFLKAFLKWEDENKAASEVTRKNKESVY